MEPDIIFMEDSTLVHKGAAKAAYERLNIKGFSNNWPPSSPDLNPIKKVQLWIKSQIVQIEPFLMSLKKLKQVVQDLWDELDPYWVLKHIENMQEKCKEVIKRQGLTTKY